MRGYIRSIQNEEYKKIIMEVIKSSKKNHLIIYRSDIARSDPVWFQNAHSSIMGIYSKSENCDFTEDKNPEESCDRKMIRLPLGNPNNHKWRRVVDIMRIHYKTS